MLYLVTYVLTFPTEYDLSAVNGASDCVGVSRFVPNTCTIDAVSKTITIDATVGNNFSVRVSGV